MIGTIQDFHRKLATLPKLCGGRLSKSELELLPIPIQHLTIERLSVSTIGLVGTMLDNLQKMSCLQFGFEIWIRKMTKINHSR